MEQVRPNQLQANQIVVTLTPFQMDFLEKQAKSEGKTPSQILVASFLRTYNPRSLDGQK